MSQASASRISSYTWKAAWSPDYHQSMYIGIAGLGLASVLAFGDYRLVSSEKKKF